MLTFSAAQWQAIRDDETHRFVAAVADQLLASRPELRDQRPALLERLKAMHRLASEVGLQSTPDVIRLLHLAADASSLHRDPALKAWLTRPGRSPEQRLADVLAVVDWKLKGKH